MCLYKKKKKKKNDRHFFFLCARPRAGFSLVTSVAFLFLATGGGTLRWRKSALKRTLFKTHKQLFKPTDQRHYPPTLFTLFQFIPNVPIQRTFQKGIESERWSHCRPYQSHFSFGSGAARSWPWLFERRACQPVWQHCDSATLSRCNLPPIPFWVCVKVAMRWQKNKKKKNLRNENLYLGTYTW